MSNHPRIGQMAHSRGRAMGSQAAATAELEGQAIDLLLNNAGVGGPRGQKIGNIDYEAWANVLDVNTWGPCGLQRHLLIT
jgi:NAD(P)-dependent dehydrogenase (short-subunit alcohol dehydrogenase family)